MRLLVGLKRELKKTSDLGQLKRKRNEERGKVAKEDSNYRATEGGMKEDKWTLKKGEKLLYLFQDYF